jgi:multiple sugar transport system ATP-binding protein
MSTVSILDVRKTYGTQEVVHGVSVEIEHGAFVVLVGPSGCGKSTLLRMVAGHEQISGGEVRIDDRVVNDDEPKDRDIAMVFLYYALYPHMTIAENMGFALKLARRPTAESAAKVEQAVEILGLKPYLGRKPGALSGGQRQRVAMGRADIKEIQKRLGTTTIYVTHDQTEAMTMADMIVVLRDGVDVRNAGRITARTDGNQVFAPGQDVVLRVMPDRTHRFDGRGRAITGP